MANLPAVLVRVGPRRGRQIGRIEQGQCLLSKLPRLILLTISQICFGKGLIGIGRSGICQKIELQHFDSFLRFARSYVILADDAHRYFRP